LSPQQFSWSDGAPVEQVAGTPTGIRTCGTNNGFTFTAPASTKTRTLRLYVGVVDALGRLEARLSTGGNTVISTLDGQNTLVTGAFTMTYRAPKDGMLQLRWVTEQTHNNTSCGGVAIQAATLR
jgi:hypothetical protein